MMDRAGAPARTRRILEEGATCWRVAPAERVALLIDGAAYYRALLEAWPRARRRIMIIGWDFDARVRLDPSDPETELQRLLPALVEACPELHVHLMIWDVSLLFGPSRTVDQLLNNHWQRHPRIHFRFDAQHPLGAAQHEKIVCVDDGLAFVGGNDLTVERWDTPEHAFESAVRSDPDGKLYEPVHDQQMGVDGEAARAVGELARQRWADVTGEQLAPCGDSGDVWPDSLRPDLTRVPVGIARTRPAINGAPAVSEVAELNAAALSAAQRSVYLETQYLAAAPIADQLVELLQRPAGPEIVILVWRQAIGWLERFAMGSNRDRLLRRLAAADRHGRLRAYWLGAPDGSEREINLHSKLIMVDDRFLRIGSSNLNHRSLGFDTECDLAIEAPDRRTANAIAGLRDRLLGEHLGRAPEEVGRAIATFGLIGAIERLNHPYGRLRAYRIDPDDGPKGTFPGTALLDPAEPLDLGQLRRQVLRRFGWR